MKKRPWSWWLMLLYMTGQTIVGILGLYDPSPSLYALDLVDLYSVLSVVFAVLGVIGLFSNSKVVMWALYGMALGAMIHGASIMLLPSGSLQTGVWLVISSLIMAPMAHIWWKYNVLETVLNRKDTA